MYDEMDTAQDLELIRPLVEAVEFLAQQLDAQREQNESFHSRLEAMEKVLMEDIVGTLRSNYQTGIRTQGIESLKSKYGERLGKYTEPMGKFYPGVDIYNNLYDTLEQLKGQSENWEDANELSAIEEIVQSLEDRFGEKKPEVVEETTVVAAPSKDDELKSIVEKLKKSPLSRG